jgi:hypothetical protein
VKAHSFDVTSLIAPGTTRLLTLVIDGTGLTTPNPNDLFSLDFAVLSITGIAVPAPGTLKLLGLGITVLGVVVRRRRATRI